MANLTSNNSDFILYTSQDGEVRVDVFINDETVWLTQKAISELFLIDRSVITKHLQNIYNEGELIKEATCAKIAQVQKEGDRLVNRQIEYYNLDLIISIGYRENSKQATQFRI
jgi:hypothetical protein